MRTFTDRRRGKKPPDPELVNRVLDMMAANVPNKEIAEQTGVSTSTMYRWRDEEKARAEGEAS